MGLQWEMVSSSLNPLFTVYRNIRWTLRELFRISRDSSLGDETLATDSTDRLRLIFWMYCQLDAGWKQRNALLEYP